MNYTLDTNMLLYIFRDDKFKSKIEETFQFKSSSNKLIISIVSVGEMRALSLKNQWGEKKKLALEEYLKGFIIISIDNDEIVNTYALIDAFSQNKIPNNY